VFEPLEDTEPPKKKALDVTLEQNESDKRRFTVKVNYIDPCLMAHYGTLASDGVFAIEVLPNDYARLHNDKLSIGGIDRHCSRTFQTAEEATDRIERITKLLDIINANEQQEGGEA